MLTEPNKGLTKLGLPRQTLSVHPQKFALWLFLGTVVMLFAALTSAYIVKQAHGYWLQYKLPTILWFNSVIILLSSVTMQRAYMSAKQKKARAFNLYMLMTLLLALVFLAGQYQTWNNLVAAGVYFVGNPAGSFLYIFTGLHAVHLISGILAILFVWSTLWKKSMYNNPMLRIEMCTTYWHFLGALWVYLFLFLQLNH